MNHEGLDKKSSGLILDKIRRVPVWTWMLILGVVSIASNYYNAQMVSNSAMSVMPMSISPIVFFVLVLGLSAVVRPFVLRIAARLIYTAASRIYFRSTGYIPDYNLRKLPIEYNDFLITFLFIYCISDLFVGVFGIIALFVPYAAYILSIPASLFRIAGYVFGAFILRPMVADWQCKRTFTALGLISAIMLCLSVGVII